MHGWVSLLIGLAAASVFVIQARVVLRNATRDRTWRHVDAEVVSSRVTHGQQGRTTTIVTYAYLADDGRSRIGHADVARPLPSGTTLPVLYDPADPTRSQPARRPGLSSIGPGLLGLLCLGVGVLGVVNGLMELTTGHGIQ